MSVLHRLRLIAPFFHARATRALILALACLPAVCGRAQLPEISSNYIPVFANASSTSFGTVKLGSSSSTMSIAFTVHGGTTISSIDVVEQGTSSLDFIRPIVGSGTPCTTTAYAATTTVCTVPVVFAPASPGLKYGAVILTSSAGERAISYLSGVGSAPLVNAGYASVTTLARFGQVISGNTVSSIWASAVDGFGNVYFGDEASGNLYKLSRSGTGAYTAAAVPLTGVSPSQAYGSFAIDGAGDLYTLGGNTLYRISGGVASTVSLGAYNLSAPSGLFVDASGSLYISDYGNHRIVVLQLSTNAVSLVAGFPAADSPMAVAADASGTVYYFEVNTASIKSIAGGVVTSTVAYRVHGDLRQFSFDANGNLIFGDQYFGGVSTYSPVTGKITSLPVDDPCGTHSLAITAQGDYISSGLACGAIHLYKALTNTSLTFGSSNVGHTSSDSPKAVTFYNTGNTDLTIAVPTSGDNPTLPSGFALDSTSTCPSVTAGGTAATLSAAASCTLAVDFIPTVAGTNSGTATLTENSWNIPGSTLTVALSGTGIQPVPTVTLSAAPNPTLVGSTVTLAAVVTGSLGTPTGTVTFYDGSASLGSSTLTAGSASLTASFTTTGAHTLTAKYAGDANYVTATSKSVSEAVADFSVATSGTATASILPGGSASFTFTVAPVGGATLPGSVGLTLSGIPQGVTAALSPNSILAGSGSTNVTLTLSTTAGTPIGFNRGQGVRPSNPIYLSLLVLPFLGLRKMRKRLGKYASLALLLFVSILAIGGFSGCTTSSGYFGQKPVSATINVTGTSGSTSHSASIQLNVQ